MSVNWCCTKQTQTASCEVEPKWEKLVWTLKEEEDGSGMGISWEDLLRISKFLIHMEQIGA